MLYLNRADINMNNKLFIDKQVKIMDALLGIVKKLVHTAYLVLSGFHEEKSRKAVEKIKKDFPDFSPLVLAFDLKK